MCFTFKKRGRFEVIFSPQNRPKRGTSKRSRIRFDIADRQTDRQTDAKTQNSIAVILLSDILLRIIMLSSSSSSSSLRFWTTTTSTALPSSSSHHQHHRRHFPSSLSSSSSSRTTTLHRTHASSSNNNENENNKNNDQDLKAKLKSFAREMNITDPNDFVDMKQGGGLFTGGKENNAAKNQIREDEQRALNAVTSAEFTKAMLGVTVGLLALYLIIGPPPVEAPLYK